MTDRYWERVAALAATLQEAGDPGSGGAVDSDLVARLTAPRTEEADYHAPAVDVYDDAVPTAAHAVPVRVYRAEKGAQDRPLLVWCHGGAFLGGDLDMPEADAVAREVAHRADAVVVSVDYRLCLAGVHFPAPNDDLAAVFAWTLDHAADLGVDPDRVTLGGASAGACLAAAVALRLRDAGSRRPAALVLAYPVVHSVLPEAPDELAGKLAGLPAAMSFTPDVIEPVIENYVGRRAVDAPAHAVAGAATDLTGMPPSLIINCEYDGLRASGERFAEQLAEAGVEVDARLAPDVAHGHLNRPGLHAAQESLGVIASWVSRHRAMSSGTK